MLSILRWTLAQMQTRFLSNLILILVLNLLVKPLYLLGIDAEVQSRVGTEIYGTYFGLINLSFLLNFFLDFGITNYNVRQVAQKGNLFSDHFSGLLSLRIILSAAYMLILLGVGILLGYGKEQLFILAFLGINQAMAAFLLFFRSNLSGLHLFKQDSILSVLDRILLIGLVGALLFLPSMNGHFEIEWFVYAQTFSYGTAALVSFILVKKNIQSVLLSWDPKFWTKILKASAPFALLTLTMMAYHRSDGIMLERLLDDQGNEAGIYARGYRFFEAASMVAYLFAVLLLPMFSRAIERKENVTPLVNLSFRILFAGAWTIGVSCFFLSDSILASIYDDLIPQTSQVFQLLMLGFVAYSTTYIFGTLITAHGSMKLLNLISLVGVIVNIALNFWLIPTHGAYGSAMATLITQGLAALIQFGAAFRLFKMKVDYKVLIGTIIFTILLWIFGTSIDLVGTELKIQLPALLIAGILLAALTGLFPIKAFLSLLKQRES